LFAAIPDTITYPLCKTKRQSIRLNYVWQQCMKSNIVCNVWKTSRVQNLCLHVASSFSENYTSIFLIVHVYATGDGAWRSHQTPPLAI
jgi:hypothetical protein